MKMFKITLKYYMFALFFVVIYSCDNNNNKNVVSNNNIDIKKPLEKANQHLTKIEETEINDYIKRYSWNMNTTNSGLRYMIYKKSNTNINPEIGSIVKINYNISLINGVSCYSSDSTGPKIFEIGKGQAETGLEEGIMLLNKGDKAKFIIPSYLAYGLSGDFNKIPKRATLIYDIELLDVK